MFPTGGNITTMRQSRFFAMPGTCSHRLSLLVFAMNMVMPPLDTENSQKDPGADELSRNSAEKQAADQGGHERDCCGDQRVTDVAPRIFPVKHPPKRHVAQNSLNDVRQQSTDGGPERSKAWNQPEQAGKRDGARNR